MYEASPITYVVDFPSEDSLRIEVALDLESELVPSGKPNEYVFRDATGVELVTLTAEPPTSAGTRVWLASNGFTGMVVVLDHKAQVLDALDSMEAEERGVDPHVRAPLPGTVTAVHVQDGSQVAAGEPVVTIEAMKMEHQLKAPLDGIVTIHVTNGQQVGLDQNILTVAGAHSTDDE